MLNANFHNSISHEKFKLIAVNRVFFYEPCVREKYFFGISTKGREARSGPRAPFTATAPAMIQNIKIPWLKWLIMN